MYKRWKFTVLLTTLLSLLVFYPLIERSDSVGWLYKILLIVVFIGSFLVLFHRRQSRVAAMVLGAPTVAGIVFHSFIPLSSPMAASVFYNLVPIVFFGYTIVVILRTIFRDAGVSADSINGAFSGYLLLGLLFGHVYCLVEAFQPGSFTLQPNLEPLTAHEDRRHPLLSYFSLVTLTTVGYGDITPRSPWARSLACIEAIIGQFYVAVIVAELIALKVSEALRNQGSPQQPASDK